MKNIDSLQQLGSSLFASLFPILVFEVSINEKLRLLAYCFYSAANLLVIIAFREICPCYSGKES